MIKSSATTFCFCICVLSALNCIAAEQQKTPKDFDADREFALAIAPVAQINSILEGEMKRVMLRQPGSPSPDLQKYIYTQNAPPIDIGDVHVPLHLRLIERERSEALVIIAVAKSLAAITCDRSSLPLTSIAHEVAQPLTGILTHSSTCMSMLTADPPNLAGAAETVRRTIRDANRASDVTQACAGDVLE